MSNVKSAGFQLASSCDPPMLPHLHQQEGNVSSAETSCLQLYLWSCILLWMKPKMHLW